MRYCTNCGREIAEGTAFCSNCGARVNVETPAPAPVPAPVPVPVAPAVSHEEMNRQENEFLETTHRLLRWERKAWSITGKVFTIMGIIFAVLFMLFVFLGIVLVAAGEDEGGAAAIVVGLVYAIILGGMFIVIGIVNNKAGKKIPQYLDTLYTDFSLAYKRCGSVGMMIFAIFFNTIALVFFIINFVRMKSNRAVIERIMRNQNVRV